MRFVDLKIRTKLYWAFGSLIVIALVLSANSLYTMWHFQRNVKTLTREYLPEMQLAADISSQTQQLAFHMEGYFLTGKSDYYHKAESEFESLKRIIRDGEHLLEQSERLHTLEQKLSIAQMLIPKYEQTMSDAFKNNQDMVIIKEKMDETGNEFLRSCQVLLDRQNNLSGQEAGRGTAADTRRKRIVALSDLIRIGSDNQLKVIQARQASDRIYFDQALSQFARLDEQLLVLNQLSGNGENAAELEAIGTAKDQFKAWLISLAEKQEKQSEYFVRHQDLSSQLVENAISLRDGGIENSAKTSVGFTKAIISSIINNFIVLVIAIALAIILAILMARMIAQPLYKGIEFVKQMAKGDLTFELDVNQKDEIGELSENLKTMGEQIRDIIMAVTLAADNMASASMELSSTSQHVSQGSSEQASSAEEISSSIEEMAANIQQNTQNAKEMVQISLKAETDIQQGKEKVDKTVHAIREIAGKISIIGDIAFQTNILALNAAVEAARAGEHGRGFGVVAEEVGKLAERSKIAALEINDLTKTGVFNAEETGDIMNKIVPEIHKTSNLIREIAAASIQQNAGAEQINLAIQQLNLVTQQNAAASEQLATNAVEMSGQAENFQEIVSFFKVVPDEAQRPHKKKTSILPKLKVASDKMKRESKGVILNLDDDDDDDFERF